MHKHDVEVKRVGKKEQKRSVASRANAVVTHVMADGTKRESVEGYEIPYNEKTHHLYWNAARTMREMELSSRNEIDVER